MSHRDESELALSLKAAEYAVAVGGRYVHYKDPTRQYEVRALGILEANDTIAVIYTALYGERFTFIRPLESFLESVTQGGKLVPRFTKVS